MVNPNIQGVVPLDGAGYVAKVKRNYESGEYRRLSNAEIKEGIIKTRRSIGSSVGSTNTLVPFTNPFPFVGFLGDYTFVASKTAQMCTNTINGYESTWAPSSLPVPVTAGSFHKIVGVFRYNNMDCWLTQQFDASTFTNKIYLYSKTTNYFASPAATVFSDLTATLLVTDTSYDFVFCNFFIQGERLWLVTSTKLYFSKATDPKIFAVPDGGFFDFQGQKFHYGMALKEMVYLLCDNSVFAISYSIDPNEDSFARQVSDTVGGDNGCIHNDTPYFINSTGIYVINANSIEKVMDNTFDIGGANYQSKIISWENYLIVNKYALIQYESNGAFTGSYFGNLGRFFTPGAGFNSMGHNVFFIDTTTGATHVLDFYDSADTAEKGYICDIVVNPNKNFYREYKLLFMTNKFISLVGPNYTYKSHIYNMSAHYSTFIYDEKCDSTGLVRRYRPAIDIEIDSYTPDGNEYLAKKFRSLEITAELPKDNFNVKIAYDNRDFPANGTSMVVDSGVIDAAGEPRTPYPCRMGLNQRGRSISIKLYTPDPDVPLVPGGIYGHLGISDIRVLWSYTKYGVDDRTPTTT